MRMKSSQENSERNSMVKSIILMSGGLDSVVSLGLTRNKYNVELALTFDYGQKAANTEIEASKKFCEFYNVSHKVFKLDFSFLTTVYRIGIRCPKSFQIHEAGATSYFLIGCKSKAHVSMRNITF